MEFRLVGYVPFQHNRVGIAVIVAGNGGYAERVGSLHLHLGGKRVVGRVCVGAFAVFDGEAEVEGLSGQAFVGGV